MKLLKTILTITIVIILVFSLAACSNAQTVETETETESAPAFVYGDADNDGTLTILDATCIQRVLADYTVASFNKEASMVSDGKELTIIDATLIQRKLVNLIDRFPVEETAVQPTEPEPTEEPSTTGNTTLVAYFSRTGNTKPLALYSAEILNADTFEIEASVPYTDDDIKYYTDCRADREQSDPTARPEIANAVDNMAQYDTIILAYPIWHGQAPKIIYTFLESYDFSGKTIIPFCTSASSGIGFSATNLHTLAPDAVWKDGRRFPAGTSKETIAEWLSTFGLPDSETAEPILQIEANGYTFLADFEDNSSAEALIEQLKGGSITIDMHDYGNFEKVGELPFTLPRNDEQITTEPGDVILYLGNNLTIYYDVNSWNFTRVAKIRGADSTLKDKLGDGNVTVTLSLTS